MSKTAAKVHCVSMSRHNGGAKIKRIYGSSTVTRFMVWTDGDQHPYREYETCGATPADRKAEAIRQYRAQLLEQVHES